MANTNSSISFAQLLLTAIPLSLRQLAATNAPAVSSILWEEFLDDKKPEWFEKLPWDVQSYLIVRFGPETAWPTATPQSTGLITTVTRTASSAPPSSPTLQSSRPTLSASSIPSSAVRSSATQSATSRSATASSVGTLSTSTRSFTSSSTSSSSSVARPGAVTGPDAPSADDSALSRNQKIGLGVGIPVGILGLAALLFACGFLCRRRRNRRSIDGSERASSPGFIPRFAFQNKSSDHLDHRAPLNQISNTSSRDSGTMNWEDEAYEPYRPSYAYNAHMATSNRPTPASSTTAATPMAMQNTTPIMAPVLNHTHSSNRARGRRTSYTSLHSVAEMNEPDDMESPVLGRHTTPLHRNRRPSLPMVLEMSPAPPMATVKRKPIPESPTGPSPAAQAASAFLLRPPMRQSDHSGSSSSGLALSTDSSNGGGYASGPKSPVSPISQLAPTNPFSNDYSYVEDYGPEYQGGYVNQDDGLMGGHRSLDRYPEPSPPRRSSSKTEWPLRNFSMGRRSQSPMWDRVYEA
jgi:hypothetical protein